MNDSQRPTKTQTHTPDPTTRMDIEISAAIEDALLKNPDKAVYVQGQPEYVVIGAQLYDYLRECELKVAYLECKADLEAGRFVRESVSEHLARVTGST